MLDFKDKVAIITGAALCVILFLLWGLVTLLMGVIWAWVGRKMPSE